MLLLIILIAIGAAIYFRPKDKGRPHEAYFLKLQEMLKQEGPGHPTLVLDLDRVDENIATSQQYFNEDKAFRIVAKSLPSLKLIDYICENANTNKIMAFHRPFLNLMIEQLPNAEFLLGKPFPIQAAQRFFEQLPEALNTQDTFDHIEWLVV